MPTGAPEDGRRREGSGVMAYRKKDEWENVWKIKKEFFEVYSRWQRRAILKIALLYGAVIMFFAYLVLYFGG